MKIDVYNSQKDLKISTRSVKKTVQHALDFHKVACDEIAIHFITNRKMCALHRDFFNDPSPTDCITFPYQKDSSHSFFLGEVFICPKTALNYIAKHGGDPYTEVTLYLVHGILHLLGFDDMNSKDLKQMRAKEKELMKHLTPHFLIP